MDIQPAQRAGTEAVFVIRCRGRNYRTIELSVIPHSDIKPVFSGVDTTLFPDRIVIAFNFVLADAGIAAAGHRAKREAATCSHAVLSAVVTVTVLKARNGQVVADICCDFLATDLSPRQGGITSACEGDIFTRIQRGFGPGRAVAFLPAL
ncbi:hypothetical protein BvCmsNSP072_05357 [Escherichia coli]|nr:hypothetical protein BvCmsNSP072_05357 [Escherichia coli]